MTPVKSLGARAITTIVSFVCGVLTIRLITGGAGAEAYALYGLLTALSAVLPFADLGAGAAVVNTAAVSQDVRRDRTLLDQVTSVERILLCSAGIGLVADAVLLVSGGWKALFGSVGDLPGAEVAAFVCFAVFCLQLPLGIWVRLQLGMHRNHVVILLQGLVSPLTLLGVWLMLQLLGPAGHPMLAVASFASALLVALAGTVLTAVATRPLIASAFRRAWRPRRYPGVRVMDVGWPMLVQLLSYPVAVSTQRYVLAQSGTHLEQAEFTAANQVFNALVMLISAAGVPLWPMYAKRRSEGALTRGPWPLSLMFAGGIVLAVAAVWVVGPWLFGFASHGEFEVHTATILWFGATVVCQALLYPLGMFIMDKAGMRFQMVPTALMALTSFGLAVLLTPSFGIPGLLAANVIAVVCCQIVPFALYIHRHRARLLGGDRATSAEAP